MTGKTEKIMSESDRLALNVAEEFANGKGLDVVVHNVCTFKGVESYAEWSEQDAYNNDWQFQNRRRLDCRPVEQQVTVLSE
jgi:hypothetical protein